MWFVYVVRCSDATLYTGVTTDAGRRIDEHNDGRGARYTRSRGPVELVYLEKARDRGAALRREHEIKRMTAEEKRGLLARPRQKRAARKKRVAPASEPRSAGRLPRGRSARDGRSRPRC
ncbi:MAG TPA: GIY-YIG nuclease family protein [Candidatus Krumholzibacteria bacterium]|nr:GIY-YIG nuclease family protein [Candidatus Krumholzibacteria bacterium]